MTALRFQTGGRPDIPSLPSGVTISSTYTHVPCIENNKKIATVVVIPLDQSHKTMRVSTPSCSFILHHSHVGWSECHMSGWLSILVCPVSDCLELYLVLVLAGPMSNLVLVSPIRDPQLVSMPGRTGSKSLTGLYRADWMQWTEAYVCDLIHPWYSQTSGVTISKLQSQGCP